MTTENEAPEYEDEGPEIEDGQEPEDEGGEEEQAEATPEPDYKAEHEKLAKLNADKAVALRSERTRARNAERQLEELRAEIAALKAPKADIPDPNEDPIGALEAIKAAILEQNKPKAADPAQQHSARLAELQQMESEYAAENPDYNEAAAFFGQHLRDELETQGYSGAELDKEFGTQLMRLVDNATKANKHPGDVIMQLANKNGFKKANVDKGAEKVNTMKAAKAASATIGNAAAVGERNISVESVLKTKIGSPERAKAFARLREEALRAERSA